MNETHGKVVYACATNQLLDQTRAKAVEYGIETSAYYASDWRGTAHHQGTGPALTNYQALLNGKSVFEREELDAVIFDDAHTAHATVRDQFTLRAGRGGMPQTYQAVVDAANDYFRAVDRGRLFTDVVERRDAAFALFLPMFLVAENTERFARALLEDGVERNPPTMFAWEHIRDNLQNCAVYLDASTVEFSPPLPPVQDLQPSRAGVCRLYLSATRSRCLGARVAMPVSVGRTRSLARPLRHRARALNEPFGSRKGSTGSGCVRGMLTRTRPDSESPACRQQALRRARCLGLPHLGGMPLRAGPHVIDNTDRQRTAPCCRRRATVRVVREAMPSWRPTRPYMTPALRSVG